MLRLLLNPTSAPERFSSVSEPTSWLRGPHGGQPLVPFIALTCYCSSTSSLSSLPPYYLYDRFSWIQPWLRSVSLPSPSQRRGRQGSVDRTAAGMWSLSSLPLATAPVHRPFHCFPLTARVSQIQHRLQSGSLPSPSRRRGPHGSADRTAAGISSLSSLPLTARIMASAESNLGSRCFSFVSTRLNVVVDRLRGPHGSRPRQPASRPFHHSPLLLLPVSRFLPYLGFSRIQPLLHISLSSPSRPASWSSLQAAQRRGRQGSGNRTAAGIWSLPWLPLLLL